MSEEIVAVRAQIEGRVQRVWFRAWTVGEATKRGLRGWVRNRSDGSVEAVFAGPKAQVDDMLAACRVGPPKARVDNIVTVSAEMPSETDFQQIGTD